MSSSEGEYVKGDAREIFKETFNKETKNNLEPQPPFRPDPPLPIPNEIARILLFQI